MDIAPDLKELLPHHEESRPDDRPLELLWVYDPQKAIVHIEKGETEHPAHFPTHQTMAPEITHPERTEGFAYSIGDGWRITDKDHHKIEDPYILKMVRAALRQEHPPAPLPHIHPHGIH